MSFFFVLNKILFLFCGHLIVSNYDFTMATPWWANKYKQMNEVIRRKAYRPGIQISVYGAADNLRRLM